MKGTEEGKESGANSKGIFREWFTGLPELDHEVASRDWQFIS